MNIYSSLIFIKLDDSHFDTDHTFHGNLIKFTFKTKSPCCDGLLCLWRILSRAQRFDVPIVQLIIIVTTRQIESGAGGMTVNSW